MKVVSKKEFIEQREGYFSLIKSGTIFIHPTDTIYGIGCNALINTAVKKIRDLKDNPAQPFAIIVPSKEWIYDNCDVSPQMDEWVDKLPGPYTLVLPIKKDSFISKEIAPELKTVAVRIPDHWISAFVKDLGYPIVSTSVNKKGRQFMTSKEDLDPDIQKGVELFIYEGEKEGQPSKIIRFDGV